MRFPLRCIGTFRPPMRSRVSSAMYGSVPIRSTSSQPRPVVSPLSGQRFRTSACIKSPCDEARALRNGGEHATTPQGWFRRRWFFASHQTRVPETKGQADPLWGEEEKNTRRMEPVRSKTQKVRGWPFFSVFSLQKKPRHAWLTPPGSDADRETATFPSCVLLPSMGYDMRVETG